MLGAAIGARKQCIFTIERDRADGSLDDVVVEFDTAIFDEDGQSIPSRQCVADGCCEFAFLARLSTGTGLHAVRGTLMLRVQHFILLSKKREQNSDAFTP